MTGKNTYLEAKVILSLLLPFCCWLGIFHQFFLGHFYFTALDNLQDFRWSSYYISNLARGVFPLWDPFRSWGTVDNFDMIQMGELNPIYLMMSGLVFLGCKVYWAFLAVLVLYFWVGCLGFFALARQVIGGFIWPYLAYVLLLFSALGVNVIWQLMVLILFVPAVWFFFFLNGFVKSNRPIERLFYGMGAVFSLMIIANSYFPFFFVLMLGCFFLACIVAARHWVFLAFKASVAFMREFPRVSLLCLVAIILACFPSALWLHGINSGQSVMLNQRSNNDIKNPNVATLDMINANGLASQTSWKEMFTDFNAGHNSVSYVPVLVFILFGLSFFNRSHRRQVVLLVSGLLIFLIALVDMTPVHPFLYKHFYIFHLFRSYFYYGPFLVAWVILFLAGELKEFVSYQPVDLGKKLLRISYIALIHVLFFIYLSRLDNVPVTSFITVILSGIWFIVWQSKLLPIKEGMLAAGLVIIAAIQPVQVLAYSQFMGVTSCPISQSVQKPEFAYMRPPQGNGFNEDDGFYRLKLFKDESGFVKVSYMGTKYAYQLYSHVPWGSLRDYVQYKFVLYDRAVFMGSDGPDWDVLKGHLENFADEAIVSDKSAVKEVSGAGIHAMALGGPSRILKVEDFDLNGITIKTDFPVRKFLVYNDSYYPGWQASVDGKKVPLYQANMAFKGLWVEAGEHRVSLRFYSSGMYCFFVFLILFFAGWFIALLYWYQRMSKGPC